MLFLSHTKTQTLKPILGYSTLEMWFIKFKYLFIKLIDRIASRLCVFGRSGN